MRVASHGGNINLTCTELDEGARLIVDVKAVPPESRRGPVATLELAKPGKAGSSGVGWPETLRAHWRIEPKDSRATFAVDTLHDCK